MFRKNIRKYFALLMSVAMFFSILPVGVFASEDANKDDGATGFVAPEGTVELLDAAVGRYAGLWRAGAGYSVGHYECLEVHEGCGYYKVNDLSTGVELYFNPKPLAPGLGQQLAIIVVKCPECGMTSEWINRSNKGAVLDYDGATPQGTNNIQMNKEMWSAHLVKLTFGGDDEKGTLAHNGPGYIEIEDEWDTGFTWEPAVTPEEGWTFEGWTDQYGNKYGPGSSNGGDEPFLTGPIVDDYVFTAVYSNKPTIMITANSASKVYDGKPLTNGGFEIKDLPNGYYVDPGSVIIEGSATNVSESGAMNVITSSPIIRDADGNDVTQEFDIVLTAAPLEIKPAPVSIKVDNSWKYFATGDPDFNGQVTGLVNAGDLGSISFYRSNNVESAGSYAGVIKADYTKNGNYDVSVVPGNFEIRTSGALNVALEDVEVTYDGQPHSLTDAIPSIEGAALTYTYDGETTDTMPEFTDAGVYEITVTVNLPGYDEASAIVVLTITPAPVTITVDSASKPFAANDPVFSGKVDGLISESDLGVVSYHRTNDDEAAGVYAGVLDASFTQNSNYNVYVIPGAFEIRTASAQRVLAGAVHSKDAATSRTSGSNNTGTNANTASETLNNTVAADPDTLTASPEPDPISAPERLPSDNSGGGKRNILGFSDGDTPYDSLFIDTHVAYIIGYPDGTVRPEKPITRAEVATAFYRLIKDNIRSEHWTLGNDYSDVERGQWFNAAISVIGSMGVIQGYPDGTFRPDAMITRAELAAMTARFASLMGMTGGDGVAFNDIAGHWSKDTIIFVSSVGWIRGYPEGTFLPDQPITRAEFMTMADRILERVPETLDDVLADRMKTWEDNADQYAWFYLAVQEATNSHASQPKDGPNVDGLKFKYEYWTEMMENMDWLIMESQWIAMNEAN